MEAIGFLGKLYAIFCSDLHLFCGSNGVMVLVHTKIMNWAEGFNDGLEIAYQSNILFCRMVVIWISYGSLEYSLFRPIITHVAIVFEMPSAFRDCCKEISLFKN